MQIVKNSKSDSAIIGHMYEKMGPGPELWNALDGIFACVILDEATGQFTVARDPMGICSLYWGRGDDGSFWFASEMKSLQNACSSFDYFPPVRSCMQPLPLPQRTHAPFSNTSSRLFGSRLFMAQYAVLFFPQHPHLHQLLQPELGA